MAQETREQTTARLLQVIAHADFDVLPGLYVYEPMPDGPRRTRPDALACVRDGDTWSQLAPFDGNGEAEGTFKMFSFHFSPKHDATGFVGWLHSHLAGTTGVGHIVVCGRDGRSGQGFDHVRGGIFDYWGSPADRADAVIAEVRALIQRGRTGAR